MDLITFGKAQKLWHKIAKSGDGGTSQSVELELHKKLLSFFQVGDYYYYIFNCVAAQMEYVHDSILGILGYQPDEFTVELLFDIIHPDDLVYFMNFENTVTLFFNQLPPEKIQDYKVRYDFRMRKANGEYAHILHQVLTIQSSDDGGVIRVLGLHTDITYLKSANRPVLSFIGLNGEPSYIGVEPQKAFLPAHEMFTKREKQIVKLLAEGKDSLQIAEELNVSKHTVITHRRNILKKTGTHSTVDLVMKAVKEGWI